MALLAYNLTLFPLVISAGDDTITLPASLIDGERGLAVNVSAQFRLLTADQQATLEALRVAENLDVIWSDQPEYDTGTLYVRGAQVDAWEALAGVGTLIDRSCIRDAGNGATAVTVSDGASHTLGTIQANETYGLRILAATDGDTVVGHYRSDGTTPDGNDAPITGSDMEHVIITDTAAAVKIIKDATYTNNFVAYLYPLSGGTIA